MGILHAYEDAVQISESEKSKDTTVITVSCPDKTGLGCDLCRIILFFGLSITRGGEFCSGFLWVFCVPCSVVLMGNRSECSGLMGFVVH